MRLNRLLPISFKANSIDHFTPKLIRIVKA